MVYLPNARGTQSYKVHKFRGEKLDKMVSFLPNSDPFSDKNLWFSSTSFSDLTPIIHTLFSDPAPIIHTLFQISSLKSIPAFSLSDQNG